MFNHDSAPPRHAQRVTLPAPFSDVRVSILIDGADHVRFWYCGRPDDLIESGAVEPIMVERRQGRGTSRKRLDAFGDHFARSKLPNGRLRIFRCITSHDRAAGLPGFDTAFNGAPSGANEVRLDGPLVRLALKVSTIAGDDRVEALRYRFRERFVGQKQRRVMWAAGEKVIVIDWARMVGERLAAQEAV